MWYVIISNIFYNIFILYKYNISDQNTWIQNFKLCGGKLQSPIHISSFKSIPLPLPALETIGYHDFLPNPLYLKNNGHSGIMILYKIINDNRLYLIVINFFLVVININNHFEKRLPYIFGGSLNVNQEYEIDHLHFHWGAKNNKGSEHILNGVR